MYVPPIRRLLWGGLVLCAATAMTTADAAGPAMPSYEDFAKHPTLTNPSLSPDGKYLAVSVRNEKGGDSNYQLAVLHLPDLKPASRLDMARFTLPSDIVWVSNTRLVVGLAEDIGGLEAPVLTGEIVAVDYDGSRKRTLYSPRVRYNTSGAIDTSAAMKMMALPGGFAFIEGLPDARNGHFYMTLQPWNDRDNNAVEAYRTLIYDVDASSGAMKEIGEIGVDGMEFVVHEGVARYAYGYDSSYRYVVYYRAGAEQPWTQLPASVTGKFMRPLRISDDGTRLYALQSLRGGPNQLVVSNLDGSGREVLAADPRVDIAGVYWTPAPRKPYAAVALDGRPVLAYLDDDRYAAALKSLNAAFPDHYVSFTDISDDGSVALVHASSDRDPGTYALFDMTDGHVRPLYQSMPWLKPDQLGERRPFWFTASSGAELGGFITLPPHRAEKNLPTIILPHGGPLGIQHTWAVGSWDDMEAQFLASRGYAVVQVNYRGSGGRGKNFEDAGKLQMGTGMMQDMLDALKWAEQQGYSDPNRVCVYGASYGGYAAYFLPVYAPQGTLKCSVAIAGVADIRVQAERSDTRRSRAGRSFLREAWGMDDPAYVAANSAIDHVDKFNVPVLIIHGEDDPRVPVQNAREMRDALEKAGKPFEYMTRPKEGHGFFKEQNNVDRYELTEKFLQKYLGPGAPVAN